MDQRNPETQESILNTITRPSMPQPLKTFYRGEPMALGITQILIGIVEIAFGVVIVVAQNHQHPFFIDIDVPYWIAIPYIISGSLSVAAAKNSKLSLVKGMLGMNVVSAVAAGIGILILFSCLLVHYSSCDPFYTMPIPPEICHETIAIPHAVMHNMTVILLVFTILEFIIAITSAGFGCASICRNAYSETTVVIFQNAAQGAPPAFPEPAKVDEAAVVDSIFSVATMASGTLESFSTGKVAPSMPQPLKRFFKGEPMALGITQILTGILEIAFGAVLSLLNDLHFEEISLHTPHWTGIMYIISGSLSVAAAKNPKIPLVKGALAMNILSAVASAIAIVIFTISMWFRRQIGKSRSGCSYGINNTAALQACHEAISIPYAMMYTTSAFLLTLTVVEFVIAIISAGFGCASVCRDSYSETEAVIKEELSAAP